MPQGFIVYESQSSVSPAQVRALQVDAAVRLENAAAQASSSATGPSAMPHLATPNHTLGAVAPAITADALLQQLPLMSASTEEPPAFTGQVIRGLSAMIHQRGGVMNMRLDPPELGELRVQMTLARGVVSAEFHASNAQAQGLLEKNLTALRSTLESQGLTVERLTVHVAAPFNGQSSMREDSNQGTPNQPQRHSHDAAGGESRGRRDEQGQDTPRQYRRAEFAGMFGAEAEISR